MSMSIEEVVQECKNLAHWSRNRIFKFYKDSGEDLGHGYYSDVCLYEGLAIKLGGSRQTTPDRDGDPGGYLWAQWCVDHQHLSAVPRVYLFQPIKGCLYHYVLIMEELSARTPESFYEYSGLLEYDNMTTAMLRDENVPEYLIDFFNEFEEIRDGAVMDLHCDNYMLRPSTGTMVITDPFSGA